jgi:thiaminase (transcriptional activator TenA)
MGLAAQLWAANRDLASAALADGFVRGLADGTLPLTSFKVYVAQDAFFLEAFARAYALALARSPDRLGLETFVGLITGVLDDVRLHASSAARWGVALSRLEPSPATLAYTDFLLATASLGSVGQTWESAKKRGRLGGQLSVD